MIRLCLLSLSLSSRTEVSGLRHTRSVTRLTCPVTNVGEIPRIASLAWRTASSGTPGPVLVDFPIDVLFTPVDKDSIAWGNVTGPLVTLPGPDPTAIGEITTLLQSAERPVVIVGTGARGVSPYPSRHLRCFPLTHPRQSTKSQP